jgi:predicted nucleic-acid-binding protein
VRAIDTNVIVRFLTADDQGQAQAARRVFDAGEVFIGTTVVLETEWVLRAGYRFSLQEIGIALRGLGGLPGVTLEEPAEVAQALDWMGMGMDFADALHLARSGHCRAFVTFDQKLSKGAIGLRAIPVEAP